MTKGKKPVRRYTPKLFVPIQNAKDRQGIHRWKQQFSKQGSNVSGLVEGFLDGNVEVLLLSGHLAVVSYHVSKPESFPVTFPVGFITADKQKVKLITALVDDYVGGVISFDNPRDLGNVGRL